MNTVITVGLVLKVAGAILAVVIVLGLIVLAIVLMNPFRTGH